MSNLVVHDAAPLKLSTAPEVRPEEAVRRGGDDLVLLMRRIREQFGTGTVVSSLPDAENLMVECRSAAKALSELASGLEQLSRPAIGQEIRDGLHLLVESRAAKIPEDKAIYGRMLIEDVAAQQPTIGAFIATCRRIRRTFKYRPEISEVLEVLDDEEYKLKSECRAAASDFQRETDRLIAGVERERALISRRTA